MLIHLILLYTFSNPIAHSSLFILTSFLNAHCFCHDPLTLGISFIQVLLTHPGYAAIVGLCSGEGICPLACCLWPSSSLPHGPRGTCPVHCRGAVPQEESSPSHPFARALHPPYTDCKDDTFQRGYSKQRVFNAHLTLEIKQLIFSLLKRQITEYRKQQDEFKYYWQELNCNAFKICSNLQYFCPENIYKTIQIYIILPKIPNGTEMFDYANCMSIS